MGYFLFLTKSAFEDFKRNKIKTFLTSLGILIGVLSVVLLMAFGYGLKAYIEKEFETLGKNLVMVLPGSGFRGGGQGLIGGAQFDERDVLKVSRIKGVNMYTPVFSKSVKAEALGETEYANLIGANEQMFKIGSLEITEGVAFTNNDVRNKSKKIVIGSQIAEKLFGSNTEALGKTVRIQGQRFKVIGVLKKNGGMRADDDKNTIIPYTTAYSFNPNKKFFAMYIKVDDKNIEGVKKEIKDTLLKRYKEDDFSVTEQAELLSTINSIIGVVNLVLVAIGSISLLVGGIGIMNIMYATVTDRTKEIGIRRAIGATKQDVLLQFLSESVILSLLGGLLGLLIATGIVALIQPLFPATINLISVMVGFGISSLIGIFFGVFPARRAANLSPIEAIRYE
ncbi:FtsX-like permease family protein [Candidatus Parcubacteria bacterium]|nr:MAG: FtsX-like permease family protein [Candidatus Parcubacteria bacterium]